MIIPTPEYDPLFADDGVPFSEKMRQTIRREFSDVLGARASLLETDQGLETLSCLYTSAVASAVRQDKAA